MEYVLVKSQALHTQRSDLTGHVSAGCENIVLRGSSVKCMSTRQSRCPSTAMLSQRVAYQDHQSAARVQR